MEDNKMKKIFTLGISAVLLFFAFSCNKENSGAEPASVYKTFTVNAPDGVQDESRTVLDGATTVLWQSDDELNVVALTTGNQYTFTLKSGAGTSSALFEGTLLEDDAEETTFYAVYPNVAIKPTSLNADTPLIDFNASMSNIRTAVKDGYDRSHAVMTAVSENGEAFSFRHGAAYLKIKIGLDGVYKVKFETSSTRFSGRPQYKTDGSYQQIQSSDATAFLAPASGTLEKDATYYVPVLCKNAKLGTLGVTYYFDEAGTNYASISTTKKSNTVLELGTVYDLGTPPISVEPILSAQDVAIAADATSGSISYTLQNEVSGGVLSVAADPDFSCTIENFVLEEPADGSVGFSCSANDSEDSRSAKVILTYTYNDTETVTASVTILQAGTSAPSGHVYTLYATGTKNANIVQTADGVSGSYFTLPSKIAGVALSGYTGYPFTQPEGDDTVQDYAYGIKMNGDAVGLSFTTSSTLSSTLTIYIVGKGTSTCKFILTPTGGTAENYNCEQGIVSKYVISLEKNTVYTVSRTNEHALILATVTEN